MQINASLEQAQQHYEDQDRQLTRLIELIRAEPVWQPGVPLDEATREAKELSEKNFELFFQRSAIMHGHISRLREQMQHFDIEKVHEQGQELLSDMFEEIGSLSSALSEMNVGALKMLNDLRDQRGAAAYEPIPPRLN